MTYPLFRRSALLGRASSLVFAAALAGLTLAACKPGVTGDTASSAPSAAQAPAPQAALDLAATPAAPIVDAPPADRLGPAPRARIRRLQDPRQGYAYYDRGYAMSRAFADAPPDYSFDYEGVRPWVWRSDDDAYRVVEPTPDGDRYYYYHPGDDLPFLVHDPRFGYGFDRGELVVVYDSGGRLMGPDYADRQADIAGRYLSRGRAIRNLAGGRQRQAVAQANWAARRSAIAADRQRLAQAQQQQADWRAYHAEHLDEDRARWDQERYRREAESARYALANNDRDAADRYWRSAQQTEAFQRAHGQGQAATPPARERPPNSQAQGPSQDQLQQQQAAAQASQQRQQAQEQAARQQAEERARQDQLAQQRVQAEQGRQAESQAAATRQAGERARQEQAAQQRAQNQAETARQADAHSRQEQAAQQRAQAQAESSRQAEAKARQEQVAATRQAGERARQDQAAQQRDQAQAAAARQAEARARQDQPAQQRALAGAQAEAARQADAKARQERLAQQRQAQVQAQAKAEPAKPAEAAGPAEAKTPKVGGDRPGGDEARAARLKAIQAEKDRENARRGQGQDPRP